MDEKTIISHFKKLFHSVMIGLFVRYSNHLGEIY